MKRTPPLRFVSGPLRVALAWVTLGLIIFSVSARAAPPEETFATARAARERSDYGQTLRLCDQALSESPKPDLARKIHVLKGNALFNMQQYEQALAACAAALGISPNDVDAINLRGAIFQARAEYDRAIAELDRVLAIDPNNARTYNDRGYTKFLQGDLQGAIADYRRCLELKPESRAMLVLAGALIDAGDISEAEFYFKQAVEINPRHPYVSMVRSRLESVAEQQSAKAESKDRASTATTNKIRALIARGAARLGSSDFRGAREDGEESVKIDPQNGEAWMLRGTSRMALGDLAGALSDLRAAVRWGPNNPEIHYNLGIALAASGDARQAIAEYTAAIAIKPDHYSAYINRGGMHGAMRDHKKAEADARQAIAISPKLPNGWWLLGLSLFQQHKLDEALETLDRLIVEHPTFYAGYQARMLARRAKGDYAGAMADGKMMTSLTAQNQ